MWLAYIIGGFIIIALVLDAFNRDDTTPEERIAVIEATTTAETIKATRQSERLAEVAAVSNKPPPATSTPQNGNRSAETVRTLNEVVVEVADTRGPNAEYCRQAIGLLQQVALNVDETQRIVIAAKERQSGSTTTEVRMVSVMAGELERHAGDLIYLEAPVGSERLQSKFSDLNEQLREYNQQFRNGTYHLAWRILTEEVPKALSSATELATDYCKL